jgi:NitT/TauT family transport system substrate-binding protein
LAVVTAGLVSLSAGGAAAQGKGSMHVAFGDIPGADMLNFMTAVARAEKRGVEVKVSFLQSEDIASQAVVSGQADIGVGTPYFPIVNTEFFKEWKDLDGTEMFVHSRGSGTEAIMNLMAKKNGISYSSVSYLPGSAVRAGAMLQGRIKATIVDAERRTMLMEKGEGKFALLPMPEIDASDEALYANVEWLEKESEAVNILLEELIFVWREVNMKPGYISKARTEYNLLPDMPAEDVADIDPYYAEAVSTGSFDNNGGGVKAVEGDFEFYGFAGTLKGDLSALKVDDFWYMDPLNKALNKIGRM